MILDPVNHTTAPASAAFLETVRVKCPALSGYADADLLALAGGIATLGYGGAHADVWSIGRELGMSDHDFGVLARETFVTLYPVGAVSLPDAPSGS
ncbi:hypothetical protein [Actinotalea sp. Marseille-Q4924]|uniref:hypothetical protein n=1 Tax=Actinotalea sp. Marseille-Q4924 TaxID=2866571 RepID=UPI001CE40861|nr:hypothetical protein [Actinotalea sp. Marseille-Q4924]